MSEGIDQIIKDWESLDKRHKEFVLRVASRGENKYGAEPFYAGEDEQVALWEIPEKLEFIKPVGSYAFKVTNKFRLLHNGLFGV
jgi:hypothetical protein